MPIDKQKLWGPAGGIHEWTGEQGPVSLGRGPGKCSVDLGEDLLPSLRSMSSNWKDVRRIMGTSNIYNVLF